MTSLPTNIRRPRHREIVADPSQPFETAAARHGRYSLPIGLGILIVGSLLLEISRLNTWDEAWFLRVATRLSHGDILYAEVFYPATPLAAYAGSVMVGLFGSELLVLKLAGIACIAGTFLLCIRISEQLRAPLSPIVFGAAVFLVELPYTFGYTILATMLLVAALAALLAWHVRVAAGRNSLRWLMLTGALAGACIATKHNVGALAGAASAISVLVLVHEQRRPSTRELLASLAAVIVPMAIVPFAVMVPVLFSGGLPAAVDYLIASKVGYVEYGGLSYETGFGLSLGALLPDTPVSIGTVLAGFQAGRPWAYVLPPAVALAAAWAWWWRPQVFRGAGFPLVLFTAAATASIFPLAEQSHFTVIAPLFVLAGTYLVRDSLPRTAGSLLGLGSVALAGVLIVTAPLVWLRSGSRLSTTAHLRGVVMAPGYESQLQDRAREILMATGHRSAFYLFPEASLYYLLTDSPNPTPYDFPLRTNFDTRGTQVVKERVERGEIDLVCLDQTWGVPGPLPGPFPELQPVELAMWVRAEMNYVTTLAACDLYSRGSPELETRSPRPVTRRSTLPDS